MFDVSVHSLRRVVVAALAALTMAAALMVALPASADETCTGTIGAGTVDDDVIVPDGASCTLAGTTVNGNVLVGVGASLDADGVTVDGNIQDDNNDAGDVAVTNSQVVGNIQLEQGTSVTVADTAIDGDLQLEANSQALQAHGNDIGGNLQANQNTGGLAITDNTIDGNLQCQSNDPAPTGSGNVVHGDAEGQCAALTGDGDGNGDGNGDDRATGRLSGPNRFATAAAIAERAFPGGAETVYLARADDFADALAGGSLADGPILLVHSCGPVPAATTAAIAQLDPQEVIALGGAQAVCSQVLQDAAAS